MQFAFFILTFAILTSLASGCSSVSLPPWPWSGPATQPNATAEALFKEGTTYFNNKRYALAIDRFQKVKVEFPFSPELVPAELKLAEAYYLNKQYPEAAAAFKEFQTLHPNNENIPFVLYHLGLVHFEQFTSNDRYQKTTEIAKGYFEQVVKNHANSPYAAPAKEKLAKCLQYLSEYEFNVATFYFNEKKYPAAIDRLEGILRRYAGMPVAANALYYLGESYRLEKNNIKAALAYEALIQHYPNDPLARNAQTRLSEVSKEKQDPLAMLLKREGRPTFASSQPSAVGGQPEGGAIQNPKSKIQNEKELNLVAKKEVVHEEPGEEKGILRRVGSALNPLGWFSSDDKKENQKEPIEVAKKEESSGSFWSSLNPFAAKAKVEAKRDPQLVPNVDEALKQKGVDSGAENVLPKAPASDLPKVEETAPPPSNTAELLGSVDTALQKEGKRLSELPPPPEAAPIFKASGAAPGRPATPTAVTSPTPTAKELIGGIDEALRRKGIDPSKVGEKAGKPESLEASQRPSVPASQPPKKIELAPKLPQEKGPLFLETGEYQAQRFDGLTVPSGVEGEKPREGETAKESQEARKPGSEEASQPSSLPASVVKGPPQVKDKPAETKVVEKKKSPDDEEEKGPFEQLREDLGRIRDALNPFSW